MKIIGRTSGSRYTMKEISDMDIIYDINTNLIYSNSNTLNIFMFFRIFVRVKRYNYTKHIVPGYSEYVHFVIRDHALGISTNVDSETIKNIIRGYGILSREQIRDNTLPLSAYTRVL